MLSSAEEPTPSGLSDGSVPAIRVAVIIAEARVTGLVRQLVETLERLNGDSCLIRVAIIVRPDVDTEPITSELRSRGIEHEVLREAGAWDPSLVRRVSDLLRSWQPDLVQTHGHKPNVLGLLAHLRVGLPWVAFYHGRTTTDAKVRLYHQLNCQVMSRATKIVAVAHGVQNHLRRRDRKRVQVIENAVVDHEQNSPGRVESRRRLGLRPHERAVGFIGRLSDEKGPDLFIDSFALLLGQVPDAKAIIVGEGPLREALARAVARLGLDDSVKFCGFIGEMGWVYDALDLVAIPSRSEVFPNVLLEAVSACVPVVSTRVGGIPNIVDGLDSVTLVDPDDEHGLASAMEAALSSRPDSAVERSRARARERFSQERRAREFLDLYRELVHDR